MSPQEVAAALNVEVLMDGTFERVGDRIRCTIMLVNGETGLQFWTSEFDEPVLGLMTVQKKIALGVARKLRGTLTDEQIEALDREESQDPRAYDVYLKGVRALSAMTPEAAVRRISHRIDAG